MFSSVGDLTTSLHESPESGTASLHPSKNLIRFARITELVLIITRNAWQSLAYSPLGAIVSPPSKYL